MASHLLALQQVAGDPAAMAQTLARQASLPSEVESAKRSARLLAAVVIKQALTDPQSYLDLQERLRGQPGPLAQSLSVNLFGLRRSIESKAAARSVFDEALAPLEQELFSLRGFPGDLKALLDSVFTGSQEAGARGGATAVWSGTPEARPSGKVQIPLGRSTVHAALTDADVEAIRWLTDLDRYWIINKRLRARWNLWLPAKVARSPTYFFPARKARDIDRALSKIPGFHGTVYRGAILPREIVTRYQPGKTVMERAFTAASVEERVARFFTTTAKLDRGLGVMFVIESKSGKDVTPYSTYSKKEREIVFRRKTRFKVISAGESKGYYEIRLEEAS